MDDSIQLALIALIVLIVAAWIFFTSGSRTDAPPSTQAIEVSDALGKMKRLWVEHSYLTRMSNIEDLTGYTGSSVTNERIVSNGQQIGRNFSNLYTRESGDRLSALLFEYHQIMFELLRNARQRKEIAPDFDRMKMKAREISDFLVEMCPDLSKDKVIALFDATLDTFAKTVTFTIRDQAIASMAAFEAYNKANLDLVNYLDHCIWNHLIGGLRPEGPRPV